MASRHSFTFGLFGDFRGRKMSAGVQVPRGRKAGRPDAFASAEARCLMSRMVGLVRTDGKPPCRSALNPPHALNASPSRKLAEMNVLVASHDEHKAVAEGW